MLTYRTTPYDDKYFTYLEKLGQDNWIYCGQLGDKLVFRKEEKKKRESKELDLSGFEAFYKLYPRKVSRGNAEKAWNKLGYRDFLSGFYIDTVGKSRLLRVTP